MSNEIIDLIKAQGYRVFASKNKAANPESVTHCYYTDGTHIAYAQWSRGSTGGVYTQHRPNTNCGTGFHLSPNITPETIRDALQCKAPNWATQHARDAVVKYRDWDHFLNSSKFNQETYVEI